MEEKMWREFKDVEWYSLLAAYAVIVAVFLIFASEALAHAHKREKLYEGDVVGIHNTVLCDTQEQLVSILEAQQESFYNALMQYSVLRRQRNEIGEPSYAYIEDPIKMTLIRVVAGVRDVYRPDGMTTTIYVVAVLYVGKHDTYFPGYIMSTYNVSPPQRNLPV